MDVSLIYILWSVANGVIQVVPPDQARKIHKALKDKGVPVALIEYEGEQHGFRKVLEEMRKLYFVLTIFFTGLDFF